MHRKLQISIAQVMAGATLLCLSAIVYGHPFIFHDSGSYYQYGEHIASELRALWQRDNSRIIPLDLVSASYLGARSPSYSLIVFVLVRLASLWALVAVHALVTAWLLLTVARVVVPTHYYRAYWLLVIIVTLGTSLPYFVAFVMPDLFAALGILAVILLLLHGAAMTVTTRWALLLLLAACASFHPTLPVVLLGTCLIGTCLELLFGRPLRRLARSSAGLIVAAIMLGGLSGPAWRVAEHRIFKHDIAAPPFAMARVLGDGTGFSLLDRECGAQRRFALCNIEMSRPLDSDVFLWGAREEGGVYKVVDTAMQRRLREEQWRFVAASALHSPGRQFWATTGNIARQLTLVSVAEPLYDPKTQTSYHLFNSIGGGIAEESRFAGEPLFHIMRTVVLLASIAGLGIIVVQAGPGTLRGEAESRYRLAFIAMIVGSIFINAAICGTFSKPWERYQARIIWIIPASMLLMIMRSRSAGGRRLR